MLRTRTKNFIHAYSLAPVAFMITGWLLLVQGNVLSLLIGIPAIILATIVYTSLPALNACSLSVAAIFPFLAYFLKQSLLGGLDVGLRAFRKDTRISTAFIYYSFKISNQVARLFFANAVSLLPGTLTADLDGDKALIHLLDQKMNNRENLEVLERKVAALFGEDI